MSSRPELAQRIECVQVATRGYEGKDRQNVRYNEHYHARLRSPRPDVRLKVVHFLEGGYTTHRMLLLL